MTNGASRQPPRLTFADALSYFVQVLTARNTSLHTITAYETDIRQFISYLESTDLTLVSVDQVDKTHVTEWFTQLSAEGRSGVTRARKLTSLRELFRVLMAESILPVSPAASISMPKKERRARVWLRPEEYTKLLSAAGGNPRDFAILQLFLQTGIRVSELAALRLSHLDLDGRTLTVPGKGRKERVIDLEKKATQALKSYLALRPDVPDDHVFLNYQGQGLSDRGVKKLIEKYRVAAGIQKRVSCHSLRHTFATYKAERGVSAFQLQQWLGHSSVTTSQLYVHLGQANARKLMEGTSL